MIALQDGAHSRIRLPGVQHVPLPAGGDIRTAGRSTAGGQPAALTIPGPLDQLRRGSEHSDAGTDHRAVLDRYCVTCHNERVKTADLMLDKVDIANPGANPEVWEKVMRKVHTGTMPPPNMPQLSPGRPAARC